MEEKVLIQSCIRGDKSAQRLLYKKFSSLVFGICLRYAKNRMEAEDSMQEAFVKIYKHLNDYQSAGSFEGWVRRISVNTAITSYRKTLKGRLEDEIDDRSEYATSLVENHEVDYTMEELMLCVQALPSGYRTVFNLYAVEGYKHKEIAEMLEIDVNTSKSQFSRAKGHLQKALLDLSARKISFEV
jgi:RNA polymerase sigma-70 factor (ECF subfamily)